MWNEPDVKSGRFHRFTPIYSKLTFSTVHQFQVEDVRRETIVYCESNFNFLPLTPKYKKEINSLVYVTADFPHSLLFFSIDRNHGSWLTNKMIYLTIFWYTSSHDFKREKNKSHRKLVGISETIAKHICE